MCPKNKIPISHVILYGYDIVIREGSPCSGRIVDRNSNDASSMNTSIKRVEFLVGEIDRLRDLFGSEFSSKAPRKVFDENCNKLFKYEEELENYDENLLAYVCE